MSYLEKRNSLSISELAEKYGESIDNLSVDVLMEAIHNERNAPDASLLQQSEHETKKEEES